MKTSIDQRKNLTPPITITIASSCPASSGSATVTIKNTSSATVSGTLQFVVKERGIKYNWQAMTYVDCAVRTLLPDEKGEAITINPGETITKNRAYTIGSGWVKDSCKLVAFVQKSDKEIIEGCLSGLNQGVMPIITGNPGVSETIRLRATQESVMLYVPYKGKSAVSIMDARGREIGNFAIHSNSDWVQLPAINYHGIILMRIGVAGNNYITRFCLLN